jgi:hypothetical protein
MVICKLFLSIQFPNICIHLRLNPSLTLTNIHIFSEGRLPAVANICKSRGLNPVKFITSSHKIQIGYSRLDSSAGSSSHHSDQGSFPLWCYCLHLWPSKSLQGIEGMVEAYHIDCLDQQIKHFTSAHIPLATANPMAHTDSRRRRNKEFLPRYLLWAKSFTLEAEQNSLVAK